MNIAMLLLYYQPEKVSSFYLYDDIIDGLKKAGHHVHVITPNPVRGISKNERKKYKASHIEQIDEKFTIHRYHISFDTDHSTLTRLMRSFLVSRRLAKKAVKLKVDAIYVQSDPPIFYAYYATKYTKKFHIPVIYNIQDLYPDILNIKNKNIYKILNHYQKKALLRASHTVLISEDIQSSVHQKLSHPIPTSVIHNWNYDFNHQNSIEVKKIFNTHKFTVTYAGNIGYMQNMQIIISTAKLLQHDENIHFIFIGDGAKKNELLHDIKDMKNVSYYPKVDVSLSQAIYNLSSINLITLNEGVIYAAHPSKTASCLLAKKPIIACIDEDSSYAKMIVNHQIGLVVHPNQPEQLKESILSIFNKKHVFHQESYDKLHDLLYNKEKNVRLYIELFNRYQKRDEVNDV